MAPVTMRRSRLDDEDVLDEVATRIWNFKDGKIEDFRGTYEEFLHAASKAAAQVPAKR